MYKIKMIYYENGKPYEDELANRKFFNTYDEAYHEAMKLAFDEAECINDIVSTTIDGCKPYFVSSHKKINGTKEIVVACHCTNEKHMVYRIEGICNTYIHKSDYSHTVYYINKEYRIVADIANLSKLYLIYNGELSEGKDLKINTYYPKTYCDIFDDVKYFDNISIPTPPKSPFNNDYKNKEKHMRYLRSAYNYPKCLERYYEKKMEYRNYKKNFYDEFAEAGYEVR